MLAVDFEKIAEAGKRTPRRSRGERDGGARTLYFTNPVWDRLKAKCDAQGISVSKYLQTLAVMSLDEDER